MVCASRSISQVRRFAALSEGEALFVESAFARLLPEPSGGADGDVSSAADFVDQCLLSRSDCLLHIAVDLGVGDLRLSGEQVAGAYHCGIAAVQRHCVAIYGRAFHDLNVQQQQCVLGLLERGASGSGMQGYVVLFSLLVQHAAQAYFERIERKRACASDACLHIPMEGVVIHEPPRRGSTQARRPWFGDRAVAGAIAPGGTSDGCRYRGS